MMTHPNEEDEEKGRREAQVDGGHGDTRKNPKDAWNETHDTARHPREQREKGRTRGEGTLRGTNSRRDYTRLRQTDRGNDDTSSKQQEPNAKTRDKGGRRDARQGVKHSYGGKSSRAHGTSG